MPPRAEAATSSVRVSNAVSVSVNTHSEMSAPRDCDSHCPLCFEKPWSRASTEPISCCLVPTLFPCTSHVCRATCSKKMCDESCDLVQLCGQVPSPKDPCTAVRRLGCKARHVRQNRLATVSDRTMWRAKLEESWRTTTLALVVQDEEITMSSGVCCRFGS